MVAWTCFNCGKFNRNKTETCVRCSTYTPRRTRDKNK